MVRLSWFDSGQKVVYRLFGLQPQTTSVPSSPSSLEEEDLDNARWSKRLEALDIRSEELDKREADITAGEENNAQIAQELEDQKKAQEEREKTFNNEVKKYDDRMVNIVQIVENLRGMQPVNAVGILLNMDDQDVIDVLRKEKDTYGSQSLGSYWLSLMVDNGNAERAAEIQRKMTNKPLSIDDE